MDIDADIRNALEGEWLIRFVEQSVKEMFRVDSDLHGWAATKDDAEVLDRWNEEIDDFARGMIRLIEVVEFRKPDARLMAVKEELQRVLNGCEQWRNWKPPV